VLEVIEALRQIKDPQSVSGLAKALTIRPNRPMHRDIPLAAAAALKENPDPIAIKPLIDAVKSGHVAVKSACAEALAIIYKSSDLSDKDKKAILTVSERIKKFGRGWHEDLPAVCSIAHHDHRGGGFEVNF
jgi:hypothetical protein